MTTTAASTANAPKPAENAHKPQQDRARGEADKTGSASDLFSALLALVSDTHAVATPDPAEPDNTAKDADRAALNPFAAMMAWVDPTSDAGVDAAARAGARDRSGAGSDAPAAEGIDITGMTRVDEAAPALPNAAAQARSAAASRPAFSPFNPNAPTPAASASMHGAPGTSPIGGAPAMVWQRGGTDALQQQPTPPLAQVRSTVALNERFGAAGASLESRLAGPAPGEFTTTGTTTASPGATGPAATSDTGTAGLAGAGSGNDASGSGSEHAADTQTGDGQPQPHAEEGRNAEGPTVSHWGTQHLRHASLRVGDGGADAIDIQLQVKGQEVQVAFQTDNAEARAQLRENAGASLADLMQRSGIQLAHVSVGSQGQPQGGDAHARSSAGPRTVAIDRAGAAAESVTLAARPLPPRADGSRPLDVFA